MPRHPDQDLARLPIVDARRSQDILVTGSLGADAVGLALRGGERFRMMLPPTMSMLVSREDCGILETEPIRTVDFKVEQWHSHRVCPRGETRYRVRSIAAVPDNPEASDPDLCRLASLEYRQVVRPVSLNQLAHVAADRHPAAEPERRRLAAMLAEHMDRRILAGLGLPELLPYELPPIMGIDYAEAEQRMAAAYGMGDARRAELRALSAAQFRLQTHGYYSPPDDSFGDRAPLLQGMPPPPRERYRETAMLATPEAAEAAATVRGRGNLDDWLRDVDQVLRDAVPGVSEEHRADRYRHPDQEGERQAAPLAPPPDFLPAMDEDY